MREHHIGCALDVGNAAAIGGAADHRHTFALGVERQFLDQWLFGIQRGAVEAGLGGGSQQRCLGRVTGDLPRAAFLAQTGGVAERGARQCGAQRRLL